MSNSTYSQKRNDYYNELDLKELKRKNSPFDINQTNQIPKCNLHMCYGSLLTPKNGRSSTLSHTEQAPR